MSSADKPCKSHCTLFFAYLRSVSIYVPHSTYVCPCTGTCICISCTTNPDMNKYILNVNCVPFACMHEVCSITKQVSPHAYIGIMHEVCSMY